MKKLLRQLLGVQTLKFILYNPANVKIQFIPSGFPIILIPTESIADIKVIDTGIVVKKKI